MKKYIVSTCYKLVEEDCFVEGCLPETRQDIVFDVNLSVDVSSDELKSQQEIIQLCKDVAGNPFGCQVMYVEDEDGRIEFSVIENGNGVEASPSELDQWKKGHKVLYYADYTFYIELHDIQPVNLYLSALV